MDLWVQLMKNGGKNKSVAFIILVSVCVYIYIYIYSRKKYIWSPADFYFCPLTKIYDKDHSIILMVGLFEQWEKE